jgi:MFS family permease
MRLVLSDRHRRQHGRLQLPRDPAAARLGDARDGPEVFGILSACFGGGALVRALLSAALGRASWKVLVLGTAASASRCSTAPLRLRSGPARRSSFIAGTCFTLWTSNANTILQLGAPDHLRGRVVSLYLWAFAGLAPVGGLLAGWLCDKGGTQLSFTVAGATGLAMTALVASRGSVCVDPLRRCHDRVDQHRRPQLVDEDAGCCGR